MGGGGRGGREERGKGRGKRDMERRKKQSYIVLLMYIYWAQVGDRSSPFLHFVRACDPTLTLTELAGGTASPGLPVRHSTDGGGRERGGEREGGRREERRKGERGGGREGERGGGREGERQRERSITRAVAAMVVRTTKPELKKSCLKTFLCPVLPSVSFLYHH